MFFSMRDFKCKRNPDGKIYIYKAIFCVRGDVKRNVQKRVSENTLNTYAPVMEWKTVRLMLIL